MFSSVRSWMKWWIVRKTHKPKPRQKMRKARRILAEKRSATPIVSVPILRLRLRGHDCFCLGYVRPEYTLLFPVIGSIPTHLRTFYMFSSVRSWMKWWIVRKSHKPKPRRDKKCEKRGGFWPKNDPLRQSFLCPYCQPTSQFLQCIHDFCILFFFLLNIFATNFYSSECCY